MRMPSPAMGVALAALALAGASGGYAASGLVTSAQIRNGTVQMADLSPAVKQRINAPGPRGPQGPPGPVGLPGPVGASGGFDPAKVTTVIGPSYYAAPGELATAYAYCPPGQVATGGGYYSGIGDEFSTAPTTGGWRASIDNQSGIVVEFYAYAVCAAR